MMRKSGGLVKVIWNDRKIRAYAIAHKLVDPYEPECVNPCTIDLRLGREFINLHTGVKFQADEITLIPGSAILATTLEYVQIPPCALGQVTLKSSLARQGLNHLLAGTLDSGFTGNVTLEFHSIIPVTLHFRQRVVQMTLMQMIEEPEHLYSGRYQGQMGPTPAR